MQLFIFIFITALAIYIKIKMPVWKGKYAETLVNKKIQKLSKEYIVFNDLLFQNNGYSIQIDHLIVSPYGIFVIETKGYKGWIFGGENSEYWTQTIYKNKYQFYNPIKQNDGHIKCLRHLLKCSENALFIPIVVFNNDADLKVKTEHHIVVNGCYLKQAILLHRTEVLDQETIRKIIQTIKQNRRVNDNERQKIHKQHAKATQNKKSQRINQGICPRCGGQIVLRQGKYDSFYGCSNYPTCKFTLNR